MFRPHWVILRPSKKTDPILHVCFTERHCGIPNAHRMLQRYSINCKNHELLDVVFSLWYVSWRLRSLQLLLLLFIRQLCNVYVYADLINQLDICFIKQVSLQLRAER